MHRALVAVTLVVLAGCSLPVSDSPLDGTVTPWSETTVVVALETGPDDDRAKHVAALRNATAYWETNAQQYLDHPVQFRVDPGAENPDLVVRVVDRISECGRDDHAAGCAPQLSDLRTHPGTATIQIRTGFNRTSTRLVMQHELGHVLGLDHADPPRAVMRSQAMLASTPQPNATERAVPWSDPTLTVYVEDSSVPETARPTVREQIDHAIEYYNRGGEGTVPENVTFSRVRNRSRADIVVSFPDSLPCGGSSGSCVQLSGVDPDRDGARERFTSAEIFVSDLSPSAVGWHVGRWFGATLGADEPGELPPAFRNASYRERRSDWWS